MLTRQDKMPKMGGMTASLSVSSTSPKPGSRTPKTNDEMSRSAHLHHASQPELTPLQEALGISANGKCLRHPNCPVFLENGSKIMSCRICFSEEKSVGIRQTRSFAAVVQQLKSMAESANPSRDSNNSAANNSNDEHESEHEGNSNGRATTQAADDARDVLQQPQTLESIMKRLAQVQNWGLRQKEKEVLSLRLQINKLEQRLEKSEKKRDEQSQTIKALRRTIQQDLKIIKTMATQKQIELDAQKQMELERAAAGTEQSGDLDEDDLDEDEFHDYNEKLAAPGPSPEQHRNLLAKAANLMGGGGGGGGEGKEEEEVDGEHEYTDDSPAKSKGDDSASSSRFTRSPPKRTVTPFPNSIVRTSPQKRQPVPPSSGMVASHRIRMQSYLDPYNSTRSLNTTKPIAEDEEEDEDAQKEVFNAAGRQRSFYWNDSDLAMANDPSKLFMSFRGGLLDIPKSPPKPRHDLKSKPKKKLQLDVSQMKELSLPPRALSRHGSSEEDLMPPSHNVRKGTKKGQISLAALAQTLSNLDQYEEGVGSKTPEHDHQSMSSMGTPGEDKGSLPMGLPLSFNSGEKSAKEKISMVPLLGQGTQPPISPATPKGDDMSACTQETFGNNQPPNSAGASSMISDDESIGTGASFAELSREMNLKSNDPLSISDDKDRQQVKERQLYQVENETCQDRYGDVGIYTGTILAAEGLPHGSGTMNYESGRTYSGDWVAGQWHGKGSLLNPNGDSYEGEFFFDARHGKGKYKWDNGDTYIGDFVSDKRHGKGKFCFLNGNVYEGEFCDGMFEGQGRYEFKDGYYEGEWKEGRYDGSGELVYADGGKYSGEFRNSVAHGFGIETSADGTQRRGIWENGEPRDPNDPKYHV